MRARLQAAEAQAAGAKSEAALAEWAERCAALEVARGQEAAQREAIAAELAAVRVAAQQAEERWRRQRTAAEERRPVSGPRGKLSRRGRKSQCVPRCSQPDRGNEPSTFQPLSPNLMHRGRWRVVAQGHTHTPHFCASPFQTAAWGQRTPPTPSCARR